MKTKQSLRRILLTGALALGIGSQSNLLATVVTYNTEINTTWEAPAGVTNVQVECWGGGGAGGAAQFTFAAANGNCGGGGGAGGAYARVVNVPVTPGNSYAIVIGPAATAPAASAQGARFNGATVSFTGDMGVTVTAVGGEGGESKDTTTGNEAGLGGTGSSTGCVGDVFFRGGSGAQRPNNSGGPGGGGAGDANPGGDASTNSTTKGLGGVAGGGDGGNGRLAAGAGVNGNSPGGGGGGAKSQYNGTTLFGGGFSGGIGGLGRIVLTFTSSSVTQYYSVGNVDPTLLTSWTNSAGANPANFTSGVFNVQSNHNMTLSADWNLPVVDGSSGVAVKNGGTLTCGIYNVTDSGGSDVASFTLDAGGTLSIGSLDGITSSGATGNIQLSGTRSYSTGANYVYNGGSTQVTGDGLPAIVNNLTAQAPLVLGKSVSVLGTETLGVAGDATTAVLDLSTFQHFVAGLQTAGTATSQVIGSSGTFGTPRVNHQGPASSTFGGVIQNTLGGGTTLVSVWANGGSLTLSGTNTYSGGTTLGGGQLNINFGGSSSADSAIGTGGFTINAGTIDNTSAGPVTLLTDNALTIFNIAGAFSSFTYGGTRDLDLGNGPVTLYLPAGGANTNIITLNGTGRTLAMGPVTCSAVNSGGNPVVVNGAGNTLVFDSLALNGFATALNNTWSGSGNITVTGSITPGAGNAAQRLVYSGTGKFTIAGESTYEGSTTINSGTLALASGGSISNTASITIRAGATFDVSAKSSPYVVNTNLIASGSNSAPARIVGPTTGTVDLGAQAISLTYDGANPALTVTNASALTLNGNVITVNNTGSALAGGTYHLIQLNNGASGVSGTVPTLNGGVVGGAGVVAGATPSLALNNGYVDLVVTPPASSDPGNPQNVQVVGGELTFSVTNSSGTYRVQGATNLASPVWVDIATNAAPFSFTNTANLPQQFFRTVTP